MNKGDKVQKTKSHQGPSKRRNQRRSSGVTQAQLNGGKFTPTSNPPDVTAQPWYPLTLAWVAPPGNVTFSTVIKFFKEQLDPQKFGLNQTEFAQDTGTPFRVQFRFRKVTVWNLSGRALSLSVYDDLEQNNTDKDQLGGWTDCGGANCFPALGYTYPYSHANRVHRPDLKLKDTVVFNTTGSNTRDNILTHLGLLWRFDGAVRSLSVIPSTEEEALDNIKEIATQIKASQPTTLERVIDGVKTTASFVSVIAATDFAGCVTADEREPEADQINTLVDAVISRLASRGLISSAPSEDGLHSFEGI